MRRKPRARTLRSACLGGVQVKLNGECSWDESVLHEKRSVNHEKRLQVNL